jgi:hypothetical protein
MAEKHPTQAATAAEYQERITLFREKLAWVRDYL